MITSDYRASYEVAKELEKLGLNGPMYGDFYVPYHNRYRIESLEYYSEDSLYRTVHNPAFCPGYRDVTFAPNFQEIQNFIENRLGFSVKKVKDGSHSMTWSFAEKSSTGHRSITFSMKDLEDDNINKALMIFLNYLDTTK
jgi:hypothetical protein